MTYGMLIDTTKCVGCRACQVSCKSYHQLKATETGFFQQEGGYQNPPKLNANNFCVITFNEFEKDNGEVGWVFAKRQCMHCEEPACAAACPVTALHKTPEGPVIYDEDKCIGCRYCVWACPFGVPTAEWDSLAPRIRKCTMCYERLVTPREIKEVNDKPQSEASLKALADSQKIPSCARACPTGALKFGDRDKLLEEAKERIKAHPDRYYNHIYGEHEAGGTAKMYLSGVPFERLKFRTDLGDRSYPSYSSKAMGVVAPGVIGLGAVLGGIYLLQRRKEAVAEQSQKAKKE